MKMKYIGLAAWGVLTAALGVLLAQSSAKVESLEYSWASSKKAHELLQKTALAAKRKQEAEQRKTDEDLRLLQESVEQSVKDNEASKVMLGKLQEATHEYERLMQEYQKIAGSKLDDTPARTPNSLYQRPADSGPKPSLVTGAAKVAPLWQLPSRAKALEAVKKRADEKWGNDFSMVNYDIEKEMKGYDKLAAYHKQAWKPLMRTLLNEAGEEWPNSYSMMVYEIEKQIEAKDKLDGNR